MIINDIKNGISISKTQKRNFYFSKTERFAIQGSGEAMEEGFCVKGNRGREIDFEIYRSILHLLEIRQIFLDSALSLKKLSAMIETNQTYVSNVVNRYFGCNLKELINSYRIEYAKELLSMRSCTLVEIPKLCGFASKSTFYSAFNKLEGSTPTRYLARLQQGD